MVLDPFCGRGTTSFAARSLGYDSYAVDISPVAVAATRAKIVMAEPQAISDEARRILTTRVPRDVPQGEFWRYAYHPKTLASLCKLREAMLEDELDPAVGPALVGIILGALHGPLNKHTHSYFSNQCPRTYAPKPAYAVKFWRDRGMEAPEVDVLSVISARAERYYGHKLAVGAGLVRLGDSRDRSSYDGIPSDKKADIIVTSPPYYGLRTYVADQWLRAWFVGGPPHVEYSGVEQIKHASPEVFAKDLAAVWGAASEVCRPEARMVIRFGAINDRPVDPSKLIKASLQNTPWKITAIRPAGDASNGKRQAATFVNAKTPKFSEIDVYCRMSLI